MTTRHISSKQAAACCVLLLVVRSIGIAVPGHHGGAANGPFAAAF